MSERKILVGANLAVVAALAASLGSRPMYDDRPMSPREIVPRKKVGRKRAFKGSKAAKRQSRRRS